MIKKIKDKIKNFLKWTWQECKNQRTVVLFLCVVVVMYFPVWGGYLFHAIFGWEWCSAVATAYLLFWAGPFTPFFPVCIGITLSIKKAMEVRNRKLGEASNETTADTVLATGSMETPLQTQQIKNDKITYNKLFWLFLIGSVLGVVIEGLFCLITKGHWESHVVSVFGAFNILYGAGAVLFYVGASVLKRMPVAARSVILMLTATILELFCGLFLRYGLGMRAWNYENSLLNYKGLICVGFSMVWGLAAFVFCVFHSRISFWLSKFKGKMFHSTCVVLSVFMVLDLILTGVSIVRWSARHYGIAAASQFGKEVDNEMTDEWMQSRFVEWEFLNNE